MSNSAIHGHGVVLEYFNDASAWAAVSEIRTLSYTGLSREVHDATTHSDTAPFRVQIAGLADGGEVSFELNMLNDDTAQGVLRDEIVDGNGERQFRITNAGTGGDIVTFPGIVTKWEYSHPNDDLATVSCTIKVCGAPTFS